MLVTRIKYCSGFGNSVRASELESGALGRDARPSFERSLFVRKEDWLWLDSSGYSGGGATFRSRVNALRVPGHAQVVRVVQVDRPLRRHQPRNQHLLLAQGTRPLKRWTARDFCLLRPLRNGRRDPCSHHNGAAYVAVDCPGGESLAGPRFSADSGDQFRDALTDEFPAPSPQFGNDIRTRAALSARPIFAVDQET